MADNNAPKTPAPATNNANPPAQPNPAPSTPAVSAKQQNPTPATPIPQTPPAANTQPATTSAQPTSANPNAQPPAPQTPAVPVAPAEDLNILPLTKSLKLQRMLWIFILGVLTIQPVFTMYYVGWISVPISLVACVILVLRIINFNKPPRMKKEKTEEKKPEESKDGEKKEGEEGSEEGEKKEGEGSDNKDEKKE